MKSQTACTKLDAREVFGDSGDRDEESSGLDILPSRLGGRSYLMSRENKKLGLMYAAQFSVVGLRFAPACTRPDDPERDVTHGV